ncbi:MAG: hypothetical protein U0U70_09375 [Chitinophagaceae bacterium]
MRYWGIVFFPLLLAGIPPLKAQEVAARLDSFRLYGDVKVTTDRPAALHRTGETLIIFFALPNGNTTAQTRGKKMNPGDDWHFDIQHIAAQTKFIRQELKKKNVVVICLENDLKSWPAWKQRHRDYATLIPKLVDSLAAAEEGKKKSIYLNGHSGGGSFIFGYLKGVTSIPSSVKRISFIDSDYGYDSSYTQKLVTWLKEEKRAALNVFAYNDSVALYNGKPVVSATGGTWYRSHLMMRDLEGSFAFTETVTDSISIYKSEDNRVQFFFKPNPDRGIYHTQQVELNGFIHSILCGTRFDSRNYKYYSARAYSSLIE